MQISILTQEKIGNNLIRLPLLTENIPKSKKRLLSDRLRVCNIFSFSFNMLKRFYVFLSFLFQTTGNGYYGLSVPVLFIRGSVRICPYSETVTQRCSTKNGVLKNFSKFTGKHLSFFNKVAGLRPTDFIFRMYWF